MSEYKVPLDKPSPDIQSFLDAMSGRKIPKKAPPCEYLIDNAVMRPVLVDMLGRKWVDTSDKTEYMGGQMDFSKENLSVINAWLDNQIAFWYHMGYDYIRVEVSLPLPAISHVTKDTAKGNRDHNRAWQGMEEGVIKTWEDFYNYPWPKITDDNFYIHQYICKNMPDGIGFITCHAGGVYEHTSRLMGYTGLCMNLHDDPMLVKAVADKLGALIDEYNKKLLELEGLAAVFQGEDFGFNCQTLIPPKDIRDFFLPWHTKFSDMIHAKGKQYFIHSCGKVDDIMDDLIDNVGIDGKHSFQDDVLSIVEYKKRWGSKIALLGGLDVNKLATYSPGEVQKYTRDVIEKCSDGGRFAAGSGNSVTSYIPVLNYLAMMDEILR